MLDESVEAIPFEYPNTLQSTYSHLTKIDKIQLDKGFDLSVYCLSDGIFCFVAKSFLEESVESQKTIEAKADFEREHLEVWLNTDSAKTQLSKLLPKQSEVQLPKKFKLGFAYSHSLFSSDNNCSSDKSVGENAYTVSNEYISFASATSALNNFYVDEKNAIRLEAYLINLTLLMGLLYEIQETAVVVSRELIQTGYEKADLSASLSDIERRVGYFHQFLAEVRLVDFLSDPFEEILGLTTAKAWDWNNLIQNTAASVSHMANQVEKLSNEARRRSEQRLNKILFAFTFLTVMEVTGTVISLYDPNNLIVPVIRVLALVSALAFAILVAKVYLFSVREK